MTDRKEEERKSEDVLTAFFDDLVDDHPPKVAYKQLLKDKEQLAGCLSELVDLKMLKDQHGKTEFYYMMQPVFWERARALLARLNPTKEGQQS